MGSAVWLDDRLLPNSSGSSVSILTNVVNIGIYIATQMTQSGCFWATPTFHSEMESEAIRILSKTLWNGCTKSYPFYLLFLLSKSVCPSNNKRPSNDEQNAKFLLPTNVVECLHWSCVFSTCAIHGQWFDEMTLNDKHIINTKLNTLW